MGRPGYDEGIKEIGRRAALNGLSLAYVDTKLSELDLSERDKKLWRDGWRTIPLNPAFALCSVIR